MKKNLQKNWYERSDKYLPLNHQPALLIDLLSTREHNSHKYLKGTGIFIEDTQNQHDTISAKQLLQLVANSKHIYKKSELSFKFGQLLWPGHYGAMSEQLHHAKNLQHSLEILTQNKKYLSPLLTPNIQYHDDYCCIQWCDAIGLGEHALFFVEAYSTGLATMCEWLTANVPSNTKAPRNEHSEKTFPWQFFFSYKKPDHEEQYLAHLGSQLNFGMGINAMIIPTRYLHEPWQTKHVSHASITPGQQPCLLHKSEPQDGILEAVFHDLLQNIRLQTSLEDVAERLSISPATLKRKLKDHGTTFQKLQDSARMHICFRLFCFENRNNEYVANYLNFNNVTNFRRAFKRWFGNTPSSSKHLYSHVLPC